jgi:AAA domain
MNDRLNRGCGSIDFKGIAAAALASAKTLLAEWLPGGRFEGREYVALNPTRNDRALGSFKINWQTGEWSDFADPNAKGGDLISLFAYIDSLDQGQAARQIAEKLGIPAHHGAAPRTETTPLIHPWGEDGPPVKPNEVRRHYYPKNGGPKLKVKIKRRNVPKRKEWLTCYRVIRDGTPTGWQFEKPKDYLDTLYFGTHRNDKFMFWPEGEKDADTLDRLELPVITFGGTGDGLPKRAKIYLERLKGRLLVIVIDNDKGGREHGDEKARLAHAAGVARIRIFNPAAVWPDCKEKGDISDWITEGGGTREKLLENVERLDDWQPSANNDKPATDGWRASILQASDLQRMTFPPAREIVPGYIAEGATLLVGKPKIGKSWLTLDLCVASTANRFVLGTIKPVQGDVLYLALEDSPRRIKKRILKLWPSTLAKWPEQLHLTTSWRRAHEGGIEEITEWCQSVPNPVMVVIDTLEKFRAPADGRKGAYSADYEAVAALQKLALGHRIAVVIVHHDRKMDADDPFDTVVGNIGTHGRGRHHSDREAQSWGRHAAREGARHRGEGNCTAIREVHMPVDNTWRRI